MSLERFSRSTADTFDNEDSTNSQERTTRITEFCGIEGKTFTMSRAKEAPGLYTATSNSSSMLVQGKSSLGSAARAVAGFVAQSDYLRPSLNKGALIYFSGP